jgi:hypothetical protein
LSGGTRMEDGDGGRRWGKSCALLVCLFACLLGHAGARFVFGFNLVGLGFASAIVARCHGEPWASNRDAAPWWWAAGRRRAGFGPRGLGWFRPPGQRRNLRIRPTPLPSVPHHTRLSFRSHPPAPFLSSSSETGRSCRQLRCRTRANTGEGV